MNEKEKKGNIGGVLSRYLLVFVTIAVFIVLSIKLPESFPTFANVMTFLRESCAYCIVILGVTFVFNAGEMDISFADIAAFTCVFSAALTKTGMKADLTAVIVVAVSLGFGLLSGFLVSRFNLNSLIVTIAVTGMAKAIALIIGKGTNITATKDDTAVMYRLVQGSIGGIPTILIFTIIIVILLVLLQDRTRFGQYLYAMGDNRTAAEEAGIKTKRILLITFVLASLFAGFGGAVMMFKTSAGQPQMGSSLFLNSYTKIFLGALLVKLGKTNVVGTFVGTILMAMLTNGLAQIGTQAYVQQIITGILLVVGVVVTSVVQRHHENALKLEG